MSLNISATFSTSYYLRNFYSSNRSAASEKSYRSNTSNHTLREADSEAVQKALKKLSSMDYSSDISTNGGDIYNGVTAFVTSYNNLIESTSNSEESYDSNKKSAIKALVSDHEKEFAKIGITMNSSGKLTIDDDTFASAKLVKVKNLFSETSDFSKKLQKYAKDINAYAKAHIPSANTASDLTDFTDPLIGSQIDLSL